MESDRRHERPVRARVAGRLARGLQSGHLRVDAGRHLPDGSRADYVVCDHAGRPEDAFTDHLRDYPCHVLRPGRGFDRAKRITIATLQTMIAEYGRLSSGYFDLVITDECHRSIYGRWSGALRHFDGIQLGLTATPCTEDAARVANRETDPEDGRFVRDTLRFFEVERPTFRYTLRQAITEGYLAPTASTGR